MWLSADPVQRCGQRCCCQAVIRPAGSNPASEHDPASHAMYTCLVSDQLGLDEGNCVTDCKHGCKLCAGHVANILDSLDDTLVAW